MWFYTEHIQVPATSQSDVVEYGSYLSFQAGKPVTLEWETDFEYVDVVILSEDASADGSQDLTTLLCHVSYTPSHVDHDYLSGPRPLYYALVGESDLRSEHLADKNFSSGFFQVVDPTDPTVTRLTRSSSASHGLDITTATFISPVTIPFNAMATTGNFRSNEDSSAASLFSPLFEALSGSTTQIRLGFGLGCGLSCLVLVAIFLVLILRWNKKENAEDDEGWEADSTPHASNAGVDNTVRAGGQPSKGAHGQRSGN